MFNLHLRFTEEEIFMEFTDVIQERFSCKKFSDRPVPREALTAVLEAGRVAPTAKNLQEQHIYVAEKPETLAIIDGETPYRYGAGTVLIVAYDKDNVFTYPGEKYDSGVEDASIVATHMLLAAANAGLDGCWINRFDPDKLARALGLPENERILMLLDLGYRAEGVKPLPNHFQRKPLSETVTYL